MTEYRGAGPVPDCTPDQQNIVEALLNLAPPMRQHDGLRVLVHDKLGATGVAPFTDDAVLNAVRETLAKHTKGFCATCWEAAVRRLQREPALALAAGQQQR
jgi:hypothetical protein